MAKQPASAPDMSVNMPPDTKGRESIHMWGSLDEQNLQVLETGETVAIKKVLQNRKFKNRELHIMKTITSKQAHPFVIALKHYFPSSGKDASGEGQKEIYLNLVLDYMPETLYSLTKQ